MQDVAHWKLLLAAKRRRYLLSTNLRRIAEAFREFSKNVLHCSLCAVAQSICSSATHRASVTGFMPLAARSRSNEASGRAGHDQSCIEFNICVSGRAEKTRNEIQSDTHVVRLDIDLPRITLSLDPVSYTHLRAHET